MAKSLVMENDKEPGQAASSPASKVDDKPKAQPAGIIDIESVPAPEGSEPGTEPTLVARVAVDARGLALGVIAVVAFLFCLQWAQKFLIPVAFGIFIAYTLSPPVAWMEKLRVPRLVGTCIVMLAVIGGLVAASGPLIKEFQSIVDKLPEVSHKISKEISSSRGGTSNLEKMQEAAREIERATNQATNSAPPPRQAAPSRPPPSERINDFLVAGSMGVAEFAAQTTTVVFLVFFLLLTGDTYRRKMVRLTGPTFAKKKITVQIMDDINRSIQHYMFTLLITNTSLAILLWGALRLIGLENAGAWAAAAGLVHVIPYFGPLLIMIATGIAAFLQFGTLSAALVTASASLFIATMIGTFLTTWMTGRIARMNPAAVFIGLLFWGWLWGVWGLLLGIPIIVVIKVIAEHIEGLQVVAELLGE
jgi:predicted PurR-regulated permease PerM